MSAGHVIRIEMVCTIMKGVAMPVAHGSSINTHTYCTSGGLAEGVCCRMYSTTNFRVHRNNRKSETGGGGGWEQRHCPSINGYFYTHAPRQ